MQPVFPLIRGDFFQRSNSLLDDEADVYQFDYLIGSETFTVRGHNNAFPTHYMVLGDNTLIFNSYRADVDTTLVGNKTLCYGMKVPVFERTDTFVPDLDARNFSLLLNEAKSQAFLEIKQVQNAKADQRARRALVHSQRTKYRIDEETALDRTPSYGRRGNVGWMRRAMRNGV